MFSFFKKIFFKKPENNLHKSIENLLKSAKTFTDYTNIVVDVADTFAMGFEKTFEYNDSDKIYIIMANLFAKFSDSLILDEKEDELHHIILMSILVRYDGMNKEERWEEFINSISFFQNQYSQKDFTSKTPSEYLFSLSGIYANYLYPDEEPYNLIAQSMSIVNWITAISLLAKHQKEFYQ